MFAGCAQSAENVVYSGSEGTEEKLSFTFKVIDDNEQATEWLLTAIQINHDGRGVTTPSLGEVLRQEGIITETGLINTVNGITADWSENEAWWKLEIDGEPAMQGADEITVSEGVTYAFIYTQG